MKSKINPDYAHHVKAHELWVKAYSKKSAAKHTDGQEKMVNASPPKPYNKSPPKKLPIPDESYAFEKRDRNSGKNGKCISQLRTEEKLKCFSKFLKKSQVNNGFNHDRKFKKPDKLRFKITPSGSCTSPITNCSDQASNISCANDQEYDEGGTSTGKEVEKPLSWENCIGNLAAKKELEQAVVWPLKHPWLFESRIRKPYKAREHPLSIIFIDEIDSVGGARHGSESRASDGTLTELLQEMNVVSDRSCVVVIGATNCPSKLDKALLRRLEKKIHITLPDADTRENLIKYYLEDTLHTLVLADFKKLASLTEG
ncbi:vacuolar protein sorting-associated protein 4-like [Folsomia candida]|uniref:vacuolar protein sorting-associated protein 4-like n=1 Tax=Folsomia candida TaxID=158441 RepID=UPI000B8F950B|nr:vacuolar protein sorting-associated protein 4-like [Folsomia candida]